MLFSSIKSSYKSCLKLWKADGSHTGRDGDHHDDHDNRDHHHCEEDGEGEMKKKTL